MRSLYPNAIDWDQQSWSPAITLNPVSTTTGQDQSRRLMVPDDYKERIRLRALQKTKRFRNTYRRRVIVEHRFARLVRLGIRKARYFGKAKIAFQVALAATVANLILASVRKVPKGPPRTHVDQTSLTSAGSTAVASITAMPTTRCAPRHSIAA